MPDHTPPTDQQLDAIEAKAAELRERLDRKNPWPSDNESHWTAEGWKSGTRNALDKLHVEQLVAEVRRLRTGLADLQAENAKLIRWHREDETPAAKMRATITRLRARQLTRSEYNSAWHAVEGAAGEDGADPGTVLHAVLDRLGIDWQDAARPAAAVVAAVVETGEAGA